MNFSSDLYCLDTMCSGTQIFAEKTNRDHDKERPSPFLKKILRQSQSGTPELWPKKA